MEDMSVNISYLTDMDGVLIREGEMIPGADRFLRALSDNGVEFMVLTNNSIFTPRDLSARLSHSGLDIPPERIWTSATATAHFLRSQVKEGTAYVVGESGLTTALHTAGWILTDSDPEFVVLGETRTYSFEAITRAIRLVAAGAQLRFWPREVMQAAWNASNEVYAETAARNPRFKKILDAYIPYRNEQFQWFRVSENSFDNFAFPAAAAR